VHFNRVTQTNIYPHKISVEIKSDGKNNNFFKNAFHGFLSEGYLALIVE